MAENISFSADLVRTYTQLHDLSYNKLASELDLKNTFPRIVVIGSQSQGKSSVLESIVGRLFIPRGAQVVTRTPLHIHLINNSNEAQLADDAYAIFKDPATDNNLPKLYTDKDIAAEIVRQTELLLERAQRDVKKDVIEAPIVVQFHSPNVVPLTLVDLPGLTEIPSEGQRPTVPKEIEDMTMKEITPPNTIIVVVSEAQQNIENVKALGLAEKVDPEKKRTLLVLTKPDLMDNATVPAVFRLISNKTTLTPKLGAIVIRNHTQQESDNGVTFDEVIKLEREAIRRKFKDYLEAYPQLMEKNGSSYLRNHLSELLLNKIVSSLPELNHFISRELHKCDGQLKELGPRAAVESETQANIKVAKVVHDLTKAVAEQIAGNFGLNTEEIVGGARIKIILGQQLREQLANSQFLDHLHITDAQINMAIKNAQGAKYMPFSPVHVIKELLKEPIRQMEIPSLESVDFVYEILAAIFHDNRDDLKDLKLYPKLSIVLQEACDSFRSDTMDEIKNSVTREISKQSKYFNFEHRLFTQHFESCLEGFEAAENPGQDYLPGDGDSPVFRPGEDALEWFDQWKSDKNKPVLATMAKALPEIKPVVIRAFVAAYYAYLVDYVGHFVLEEVMATAIWKIEHEMADYVVAKILTEGSGENGGGGSILNLFEEDPAFAEQRKVALQKHEVLAKAASMVKSISWKVKAKDQEDETESFDTNSIENV